MLVKRIKRVSDINLNIPVLCTFELLEIPLSTNITVLCTYAGYPANYPQFVQCSSFSGKLQSSALHLCWLPSKLSTICSVHFVIRNVTKQFSALMPATITNYLQFVHFSSFSEKLISSALHLYRLSLQFIYNLFKSLRFQEYYKAAELRNICRNEVME
jgi:hypothetical protein